MAYSGEFLSLVTAISWTATALFAEVASKRMGSITLNVVRMCLSLILLSVTLWITLGSPYPVMADGSTWLWLCMSGFVGYVFGDYCLFQSYVVMGSRFGQLFMTLASPAAALTAWVMLGEHLSSMAVLAMVVTLLGISMSVLAKGDGKTRLTFRIPLKGVFYGVGAGMGQGVGLVLSKVGMEHYETSASQFGFGDLSTWVNPDALFPVPLSFMMPFASTMIRATVGMLAFSLVLFYFKKDGRESFRNAVTDAKAMWCAVGAAVFGPFIGVSLSLMATLYTHAGIAQTIMALTPVLIILPSWLLFRQKITPLEVIGACVSVVGVSLFFI